MRTDSIDPSSANPVRALSTVAVRGFANAEEAARAVLGLIHELVGLRICVVTRVDLEANELTVVAALDAAKAGIHAGMVVPADELPCDYVVRTATPLRVYDLEANPIFHKLALRARLGLRSYIGVPLKRSDGTVWGTLTATDRDLHETSEADLQTLMVLARLLVLEYELEEQRAQLAAHAKMLSERLAMAEMLEKERLRAVRLQTVLEAAATVSHEINNPLTVLQLRLGRLMKRCPAEDADALDDLETAIQAADEIQNVTVTLRSVVQPVSTHYLRGRTRMLDLAASIRADGARPPDATAPAPPTNTEGSPTRAEPATRSRAPRRAAVATDRAPRLGSRCAE
jgi:signal transduction histidine kinase